MAVRVILFPPYSDLIGEKVVTVELKSREVQVNDFFDLLEQRFPQLKKYSPVSDPGNTIPGKLILVNGRKIAKYETIKNGDEIKILFPLSGG
jgi:molybdopterin converting factor small subunit